MRLHQLIESKQNVAESAEDRTSYQVAKILSDKGIKYERGGENELINAIGMVLVKELNMSPKQARGLISYDEDFISDTMSELQHMSRGVKEEFNGEYDDEAGMAKSNLRTMARAVNGLLDTIEDNDNLPEWAQEKIAKAEMMTTSVWDYLLSQKEQGMDPKVAEDVTEGNDHSLKKVWDRYSKHLAASCGDHSDVTQIHKSGEITRNIRKYVRDHHGQKAVDDMERYADRRQWNEDVTEASQRVDSLVTDTLRIMKGPEVNDAIQALKTVLGDREYNGRRGHYNFYVRQILDMYRQQGMAASK